MPKAWEDHKAELIQLYIVERRTLKDVQDLLRRHHGFKASTRAYRMKIDEWGLRKYKSNKERQALQAIRKSPEEDDSPAPSPVTTVRSTTELDTSEEVQLIFGDISIPAGPVDCAVVLSMISGPYKYRHALEILLVKWQPGGQYLKAAQDFLQDSRACMGITEDPPTPNLFQLAESNVPSVERSVLIKALLEADLSLDSDIFFFRQRCVHLWVKRWRLAAKETEWNEAKKSLYHTDIVSQGAGETFGNCALVVIAERLLKSNQERLEDFRGRAVPLSAADLLDAERCRRRFMDILNDFYATALKLHPSFYEYSMRIFEWNEALAKESQAAQRQQQNQLANTQAKYRRLISTYTGRAIDSIDDSLDDLLKEAIHATVRGKWPNSVQHIMPNPVSSPRNNYSSPIQVETINESSPELISSASHNAVTSLRHDWKAGQGGLTGPVITFVEGYYRVMFSRSATTGTKSIFDSILEVIQRGEQTAFTKALLSAYAQEIPPLERKSETFLRWHSAYKQSNWADFKTALGITHLERGMSLNAAQLVLDCTFVLVGERLLEGCNSRLLLSELPSASQAHYYESGGLWKDREEYSTILEDFRTRCINEGRDRGTQQSGGGKRGR